MAGWRRARKSPLPFLPRGRISFGGFVYQLRTLCAHDPRRDAARSGEMGQGTGQSERDAAIKPERDLGAAHKSPLCEGASSWVKIW
jgi:hypothetical protein